MNPGVLYLIPAPLGESGFEKAILKFNQGIVSTIRIFIVEEIKTARRFIRRCGYSGNFEEIVFLELNEHTKEEDSERYLEYLLNGENTGLMSEAGLPCIADPGYQVVKNAHRKGIRIVPLTGPSSIMMALMASGFNGQQFIFHGYLPVKETERNARIRELEQDAGRNGRSQLFIEAPYRNQVMFESLLKVCHPQTMLCIAADITLDTEIIQTMSIQAWKTRKPPIHKKPVVFIISRDQ